MPIDRKVFAAHMVLLGERFNRPVSKAMMAAYYRILDPHFKDDAHFEDAFTQMFSKAKFFPSPEEILTATELPAEELELRAMNLLQEAKAFVQYSGGRGQVNRREQFRDQHPDAYGLVATLEQTIGIHWTAHAIHVGLTGDADQFDRTSSIRITENVLRAAASALKYRERVARDLRLQGPPPTKNFLTAGDPDEGPFDPH